MRDEVKENLMDSGWRADAVEKGIVSCHVHVK